MFKKEAAKLFTNKGLKLGNYHYDVERYENDNGVVVSLTRYFEECSGCPLFDEKCYGENPPLNNSKYPCSKMLPVLPYSDNYEFEEEFISEDNPEFNEIEQCALQMIFDNKDILNFLYLNA